MTASHSERGASSGRAVVVAAAVALALAAFTASGRAHAEDDARAGLASDPRLTLRQACILGKKDGSANLLLRTYGDVQTRRDLERALGGHRSAVAESEGVAATYRDRSRVAGLAAGGLGVAGIVSSPSGAGPLVFGALAGVATTVGVGFDWYGERVSTDLRVAADKAHLRRMDELCDRLPHAIPPSWLADVEALAPQGGPAMAEALLAHPNAQRVLGQIPEEIAKRYLSEWSERFARDAEAALAQLRKAAPTEAARAEQEATDIANALGLARAEQEQAQGLADRIDSTRRQVDAERVELAREAVALTDTLRLAELASLPAARRVALLKTIPLSDETVRAEALVAARRERFIDRAGQACELAQAGVQLARQLGVKVDPRIDKGLRVLQAGLTVARGIATKDPFATAMGAMALAGALLHKDRPDPTMVALQELGVGIDAILAGQQEILGRIDRLQASVDALTAFVRAEAGLVRGELAEIKFLSRQTGQVLWQKSLDPVWVLLLRVRADDAGTYLAADLGGVRDASLCADQLAIRLPDSAQLLAFDRDDRWAALWARVGATEPQSAPVAIEVSALVGRDPRELRIRWDTLADLADVARTVALAELACDLDEVLPAIAPDGSAYRWATAEDLCVAERLAFVCRTEQICRTLLEAVQQRLDESIARCLIADGAGWPRDELDLLRPTAEDFALLERSPGLAAGLLRRRLAADAGLDRVAYALGLGVASDLALLRDAAPPLRDLPDEAFERSSVSAHLAAELAMREAKDPVRLLAEGWLAETRARLDDEHALGRSPASSSVTSRERAEADLVASRLAELPAGLKPSEAAELRGLVGAALAQGGRWQLVLCQGGAAIRVPLPAESELDSAGGDDLAALVRASARVSERLALYGAWARLTERSRRQILGL